MSILVTAPRPRVRFFAGSKASSIWSGPLLSLLPGRGSREEALTRVVFSSKFLFTSNKGGLCACMFIAVRTGRDAKEENRGTAPRNLRPLTGSWDAARATKGHETGPPATPATFEFQTAAPWTHRSVRRGQSAPATRPRTNHSALRLRGSALSAVLVPVTSAPENRTLGFHFRIRFSWPLPSWTRSALHFRWVTSDVRVCEGVRQGRGSAGTDGNAHVQRRSPQRRGGASATQRTVREMHSSSPTHWTRNAAAGLFRSEKRELL